MVKSWLKSKKFIALVILIILGIIFVPKIFGQKNKLITAQVNRGTVAEKVAASGKTKSLEQAELHFQTAGKLVWIGAKEGDEIKQWQTIATLDRRDVEKNIRKKLLAYMNERWDFESTQDTYRDRKDQHLLTTAEQRILDKAQFDLDSSVVDVEIADLAKTQSILTSPIGGILVQVDTPVAGVNVTAADTFLVADPNKVVFQANIEEMDISKIKLDQEVKVALDAYPNEEFSGRISKVGYASVVTAGGGTAFPVQISLPKNENLKFKIGMNGDIETTTQKNDDVLLVTNGAILNQDGKVYAWVVKKGKPVKMEITTGLQDEENTEVVKGLNEGDEVVSENISTLEK